MIRRETPQTFPIFHSCGIGFDLVTAVELRR